MTHTLVVGVDGSGSSFAALLAAADLAEQTGSQLSVVFVHDPGLSGALAGTFDGSAELYLDQTVDELEAASRERALPNGRSNGRSTSRSVNPRTSSSKLP
jgi:nucleotide-binding universal stress UspA family protein